MTSTTILRPPYSATHPWESGDWGSSGFGSSFMQKLSNDRQRGGAVDDSHDMKGDKSGNQSKPAQRSKQQQSPAATGFHSPKKPTMALKGDPDSNAVLKRSFSTPAVRSMARDYNQQPASATGEKKRNKLGYHRTSIACTHCRRRKIRCIVSTDVQNRCVNCIRLKKECSFHPVDQQPTHDSKSKASSQDAPNSGMASQSSSPAPAPGHMADMPSTAAFIPQTTPRAMSTARPTMPSPANIQTIPPGQANIPLSSDSQFFAPTQSNMPWSSAEPSPVAMPNSAGLGMGWGSFSSEPSGSDQYTPYPQSQNVASNPSVPPWLQQNLEAGTQPDWQWAAGQPPSRSMSFSGDLMTQPQQQMMPVAGGQPYQGINDVSNLFAAPMPSRAGPGQMQSNSSPLGQTPWQQGQQQMVVQHRQQNMYRQQPSGFDGWDFPSSEAS